MKFLIAGLGNIGAGYEGTRHNIGFDIVSELVNRHHTSFELARLALKAEFKYKGKQFHLIKPTTFMNLSGKSVRYWLQLLKIPNANLLVIVDDIALPFGKLRLKSKGSDGGHNGLKHISQMLESQVYPRLRFGIGDNFSKKRQSQYVLGKWTREEEAELPILIDKAVDATIKFATIGIGRTMNFLN